MLCCQNQKSRQNKAAYWTVELYFLIQECLKQREIKSASSVIVREWHID